MKFKFLLSVLFFSFLSTGCDEEFQRKYPIIKTSPPSDISTLGATFSATIEHVAGQPILEHGFIWENAGSTELSMNLGSTNTSGVSFQVRSGINVGEVKVKAYLKTASYTVYGEVISFTGQGSEGPVVTSFSPVVAKPLDTITVVGRNFISYPMWIGSASNSYVNITHETSPSGTTAKFVIPFSLQTTQTFNLRIGDKSAPFPGPLDIELPFWKPLNDFPGAARENAFSFAVNGKGYMGTGTGSGGLLNDFWEYDPATDQWTQLADFPGGARANACVFVVGDKAYVGLGEAGPLWSDSKSDLWLFDPATHAWTPRANYPGGQRWGALSFGVNGKGYFGGGKNHQGLDTFDFWEYGPGTDTWISKPNIPQPIVKSRAPHYAFEGSINYFEAFGYYYRFDFNAWAADTPPHNLSQSGWTAMAFDDQVFLLGERNMRITGDILSMIEFPYNGVPRTGGSSFVINGKGYYGFGRSTSGQLLHDLMELDSSKF